MTFTGWYLPSLHRHMTRVPTSRGSTDDLRRFDVLDSSAVSAPSKGGDFPLPLAVGVSIEPMGEKDELKTAGRCAERRTEKTAGI